MARVEEAVERLGSIDLFEGLPTEVLLRIALLGGERSFEAGEAMVHEGTAGGELLLIFDGEALVTVGGVERATLGSGDYFGEISLLDSGPRSATVTAKTPVQAFAVAGFSFRPLLAEHQVMAETVIVRLCQRLRAAEQALAT